MFIEVTYADGTKSCINSRYIITVLSVEDVSEDQLEDLPSETKSILVMDSRNPLLAVRDTYEEIVGMLRHD